MSALYSGLTFACFLLGNSHGMVVVLVGVVWEWRIGYKYCRVTKILFIHSNPYFFWVKNLECVAGYEVQPIAHTRKRGTHILLVESPPPLPPTQLVKINFSEMMRALLLVMAAGLATEAKLKPKPNILLLFPDQWRWDWTELNPNLDIHTPNTATLAASGTYVLSCPSF